jgi:hypothetical protein
MSSDGRSRRRELVEEAYNLQVKAGLMASRIPFAYYCELSLIASLPLCAISSSALCSFFHSHNYILLQIKLTHTDRAQRNMAHSDSARRFWPIVPGPLSSQSIPAQPTALREPKCFFYSLPH